MSNFAEYTRQEFASVLWQRRKSIDIVNKPSYNDDSIFVVWINTGCYVSAGFLIHAQKEDLSDFMEIIAEYCLDKGYKGYFADEEYLQELRNDAIEAGHDDDYYISDFYMYTESGYFSNPIYIDIVKRK